MERGAAPTSTINQYATAVGKPRKVDDLTVEFQLAAPNPIFHAAPQTLWIASKVWCEKNRVTKPLSRTRELRWPERQRHRTLHAGEPRAGHQDGLKRNPNWWGRFEGNVQEIVYTPIGNDAISLAALVSGEIDFVLTRRPRDIARLQHRRREDHRRAGEPHRLHRHGPFRDKLLYGSVPGDRKPVQGPARACAMYQAIDIETMKTKLMNGLAVPTGGLTPSPLGSTTTRRSRAGCLRSPPRAS